MGGFETTDEKRLVKTAGLLALARGRIVSRASWAMVGFDTVGLRRQNLEKQQGGRAADGRWNSSVDGGSGLWAPGAKKQPQTALLFTDGSSTRLKPSLT